MKTAFLVIALAVSSLSAFSQDCKPKKGDATVEQYQGIYIFVDSTPKAEYKFLGTVGAGSAASKMLVSTPEYDQKKLKLIKKAKEEYPTADGLIIHFVKGGKDTADAIKFNE